MKCIRCGNPRFKKLGRLKTSPVIAVVNDKEIMTLGPGRFNVYRCPRSGCGKTYYSVREL